MSLIRWNPSREMRTMRDLMDRFFEEMVDRDFDLTNMVGPTLDMYQTEENVVVKAALPGVKPEDIQISVTGDVLTLRGEFKDEDIDDNKAANYHIQERRFGTFSRTITLPTTVDSDKASAEFDNGILTLTLPKSESVRPKTINVKSRDLSKENK